MRPNNAQTTNPFLTSFDKNVQHMTSSLSDKNNNHNNNDSENITVDEVVPSTSNQSRTIKDVLLEAIPNNDLLVSKCFYFFFFAAFGSLFPLMGIYFKQLGMNPIQAGILTGVRPFIEIISAPFWGSLADRFRKGKILLILSMISWIVFTSALAYIRTPVEGCVTLNETHHIYYHPYLDENSEAFEISIAKPHSKQKNDANILYLSLNDESYQINNEHLRFSKRDLQYRESPKHITGKSPITIEYTLNYNKDNHATYVSPPFSTLIYKWDDVESVFFLLWLLILLGEFFSAPAITLADAVTLDHIGDNIDNYGKQRMFGSVGWAISMLFVGIALDNSKEFVNHPCGPHESERNYVVCFKIFAFLMIIATGFAFKFHFIYQNDPTIREADVPLKPFEIGPKSIFNTAPPINPPPEMIKEKKYEFIEKWKSAVFAQRTRELPEWMEVFRNFSSLSFQAFLFVTWFMGCGIGLVFTFLFWHLQDLGGTPTLFGLASVINHISEIAAYFYSLECIKKYGHTRVLCFGLICNIFRFLYIAWLDNPWLVLPIELVQGITHATVWAACCSYIIQATPPYLKASTLGVLQGIHHGLGRGCGAILGGIFINEFGTPIVFAAYSLLSLVVLCFFVFINYRKTNAGFRWFEDDMERQVYIDEGSGIAPHGCPCAPIARTASKSNLDTPHDSSKSNLNATNDETINYQWNQASFNEYNYKADKDTDNNLFNKKVHMQAYEEDLIKKQKFHELVYISDLDYTIDPKLPMHKVSQQPQLVEYCYDW